MRILVIGCNHRSAAVAVRERLTFGEAEVPMALRHFAERFTGAEALLVSTCNRMELYFVSGEQGRPRISEAIDFLAEARGLKPADFASALYHLEDTAAIRHLFQVVSSLDSMVLGESQILGQVKRAYAQASQAGTVGPVLTPLLQQAFAVAKDVHTRTDIAAGHVSVGSTAVELARQVFSRFDDKIVLMVGAGKMGDLTLNHLLDTKPKQLWVTNRTEQRASELAVRITQRHGVAVSVVPFAEWVDRLAQVDIVISSTGAHEPILTGAQFAPIPARRRYRSLLFIDIAVPRNIEPAVEDFDGVFLYNIDDLQQVTEATLAQRKEAAARSREIIEAAVIAYLKRGAGQEATPVIQALQQRFGEIFSGELAWLAPKLEQASPHDRAMIEQMSHRVMQKLLNDPLQTLHQASDNGLSAVYADALRTLFKLHGSSGAADSRDRPS